MSIAPDPQPNLGPYPVPGPSPQSYMTGDQALQFLQSRYPTFYTPSLVVGDGDVLIASMRVDEEGPFIGVKASPEQDRQWPRSFTYGWPNIVASPSPLLVSRAYPGAWYLDYEGVVPQQILDWVALECYRLVSLEQTKVVTQESVPGASVRYAPNDGYLHGQASQLDVRQQALLGPFLRRDGTTVPFLNWSEF